MADDVLQGSCLCGAIALTVEVSPEEVLRCHCRMCRKAHGGPYATFARFPHDAMTFTRGAASVRTYRSSAWAYRTFCGECGAALQFVRDGARTFGLALPILDSPVATDTVRDVHGDSRVGW